jgi:hypothetical protein
MEVAACILVKREARDTIYVASIVKLLESSAGF